jgi:polyisoprenoid-binding protein YceI
MRMLAVITPLLVATGVAAAPTYELDVARSNLVVHVHKTGLFSAFEHDHFLHPQRWRGTLTFVSDQPETARVELVVDAASLVDRQPKLTAANRQKVEEQIRSPMVLDAARFPEVRFTAERLELRGPRPAANSPAGELSGVVTGKIELHGHTLPLALTVRARYNAGGVSVTGRAQLEQSHFGIQPMHKGGLGVEDRVDIDFEAVFIAPRAK